MSASGKRQAGGRGGAAAGNAKRRKSKKEKDSRTWEEWKQEVINLQHVGWAVYGFLDLRPGCPQSAINRAYRQKCLLCHPDKHTRGFLRAPSP